MDPSLMTGYAALQATSSYSRLIWMPGGITRSSRCNTPWKNLFSQQAMTAEAQLPTVILQVN
jgi:hypothetical protein